MTHSKEITQGQIFVVFFLLLGLVLISFLVSYIHIPHPWGILLAIFISAIKALLVALYFMHLKKGGPLVLIYSSVGLVWLGVLLVLTLSDYYTRSWPPIPGK